jgi:hypothetical protein
MNKTTRRLGIDKSLRPLGRPKKSRVDPVDQAGLFDDEYAPSKIRDLLARVVCTRALGYGRRRLGAAGLVRCYEHLNCQKAIAVRGCCRIPAG